jgi:hypothetical protein
MLDGSPVGGLRRVAVTEETLLVHREAAERTDVGGFLLHSARKVHACFLSLRFVALREEECKVAEVRGVPSVELDCAPQESPRLLALLPHIEEE